MLAGLGPNRVPIVSEVKPMAIAAEAIIDFTVPAATVAFAALAAEAGIAHIIGTTGLSAEDEAKIKDAASKAVIVKSGNMSLGRQSARRARPGASRRRSTRSSTSRSSRCITTGRSMRRPARRSCSARAAAEGRGIDLDQRSVRSRDGHTGARQKGDIGFAALRGGTVVGEHSVIFAGPAERIELVHKAEDRMIFARGALKAAMWTRGQKPGLYSMADVLGLSGF